MNYILFDGETHQTLLPLTYTRSVADIRMGILTIREKWEKYISARTSTLTARYLSKKHPLITGTENVLINAALLPNQLVFEEITSLKLNEGLYYNNELLAANLHAEQVVNYSAQKLVKVESKAEIILITRPWHIFQYNDKALRADFELLTKNRISQPVPNTNTVLGIEHIFIEDGATVQCAILNATTGPIYIGKHAEVMEGTIIRGPFALGEHSVTKLGTKIYGATTIGPYSKVGGEVNNSVIFGYSNKAHDGFLGNSVLGEWCNLGADTNNSNLKNNYSLVKAWDYTSRSYINTGLQFFGLVMGDHAKSGINTMFNTGTVVGVCANVFGAGFPDKHIPSFAWGGAEGMVKYRYEEALEVATRVYERRELVFNATEQEILKEVELLDAIS